jgi:hypothetical protein
MRANFRSYTLKGNQMKKIILSGVMAALLSTTAMADTSSTHPTATGMGILENEYVKAGINGTAGTFGSGGGTRPGLQYDSTGTGTFPADGAQGDYLTPGSPFDGFALKIDGTNSSNNNGRSNTWVDADGLTDTTNGFTWQGTNAAHSGWMIENNYSLGATSEYIDITTNITAGSDAATLSFGRMIDPDAMPEAGDTSATDNVLGYGTIPDSNVAFAEATVSRYALGLYSTDSNVDAGISRWSQEADAYTENTVDGDGSNTNTGDNTIGLSWAWTGVSAGDIMTASYAYIFGPSAFDAATSAIAGGAGGGVDITTGTLEDVGSATDAADGVVVAPVITTETVVNTALPVLTAGITHHTATATTTVQTIARETTTTTTTPMVTNTYSDGVLTGTAAATSVISTAVTDPGSFVGRIDQIDNAQTMQNMSTRELDFAGVTIVNNNATNGKTSGVVIGNTKELDNGMTIGAGVGRLSNNTTNADGSASASSTILNLNGDKKVQGGTVSVDLTHSVMDLTASRTIGDFANASTTSGTDTSVGVRFVADGEKVRPVIGYTRGRTTVDGYTETGSIQSARTVTDTTDYYGYATIGAQVTLAPGLEVQALRHTDGVNVLSLDFDKEWQENKSFNLGIGRSMSDLGNSTSISAGIQIKF